MEHLSTEDKEALQQKRLKKLRQEKVEWPSDDEILAELKLPKPAPWYVVDKDLARNVLLVAQGNDHPALFKSSLTVTEIYWVSEEAPPLPLSCAAKVRYRQADQACTLSGSAPCGYRVDFDKLQRAITPGQSVVFYQNDRCLGGGVIAQTGP